ncbi:MAG: hypothetical protein ACRD2U_14920 [Terriglobales bacterium]
MDKIECSVWNNGGNGWGLKILGGLGARTTHFHRNLNPILVDLGDRSFHVNIDKKSFWTEACGELINEAFRDWFTRTRRTTGDRVWLEVVQPYRRFKVVEAQATAPAKEAV